MNIKNEGDFQSLIMSMFGFAGHACDHRLSGTPHIPDMSAAAGGQDFWLELKYDRFRLGHDRYDEFKWTHVTAGQLDWLHQREKHSSAICGVLGYMACGTIDFMCFTTARQYRAWEGTNVGAMILQKMVVRVSPTMTSRALIKFLRAAASDRCTPAWST